MNDPPLWVLPPLEPSASWLVVFSWIGACAFGLLVYAGIAWGIVSCL